MAAAPRKLCAPVGIESITVPASPTAAQGGQGVQPGDTVTPLPLRVPVVAGDSANKRATRPPWAGHTRLHAHLEVCVWGGVCACTSHVPPSSVLPKCSTESTGLGTKQAQNTNTRGMQACFHCL